MSTTAPVYGVKPNDRGNNIAYCDACRWESNAWPEVYDAMLALGTHRQTEQHLCYEERQSAAGGTVINPTGNRHPQFPLAQNVKIYLPIQSKLASELTRDGGAGAELFSVDYQGTRYTPFLEGSIIHIRRLNIAEGRHLTTIREYGDGHPIQSYYQAIQAVNDRLLDSHSFEDESALATSYSID